MTAEKIPTTAAYIATFPKGEPVEAFGAPYRAREAKALERGHYTDNLCACCGKPVKGPGLQQTEVYLTNGGLFVAPPTEEQARAAEGTGQGHRGGYACDDLMYYPLGADCIKRLVKRGLPAPKEEW